MEWLAAFMLTVVVLLIAVGIFHVALWKILVITGVMAWGLFLIWAALKIAGNIYNGR